MAQQVTVLVSKPGNLSSGPGTLEHGGKRTSFLKLSPSLHIHAVIPGPHPYTNTRTHKISR